MPATDDEIHAKYLDRAIRELNQLNREGQACGRCPRDEAMPVVGSGHPRADVVLLKHTASRAEFEEGVAFYGRAGQAALASVRRLGIDPTTIYGTVCVKCPVHPDDADPACVGSLAEELAIVGPRIVVAMGSETVDVLNRLGLPLADEVRDEPGVVRALTPTCDVLVTPSIDEALDHQVAKVAFWTAFRELGAWHAALPPY